MYSHTLTFALEADMRKAIRLLRYEGIIEIETHFLQDDGIFTAEFETGYPFSPSMCQRLREETQAIASAFNQE